MLDQSSAKFSGGKEPGKLLASLQPSPSRDKRNIQSANLHTSKSRLIERNRRFKDFLNPKASHGFRHQLDIQNSKSTANTHANDDLSSKRTASQVTQHLKSHQRGLSGTVRGGRPRPRLLVSTTEHTGRSLNRSSILGGEALTSAADPSQEGFTSQMMAQQQDERATKHDKVQKLLELRQSDPEGFQMALDELCTQAGSV